MKRKKVWGITPQKEPFLLYVPFRLVLLVCRALTTRTCFLFWGCTKYHGLPRALERNNLMR